MEDDDPTEPDYKGDNVVNHSERSPWYTGPSLMEILETVEIALLGTFLAILLHKPLDALSITSLMAAGGWSVRRRQLVNAGFAMMCPIGAFLAFFGLNLMPDNLVGWALGFAAGCFLCISLGDLLPELHFHAHDRVKLSVLLLLGVLLAYGVGRLENARLHVPGVPHHHGHEH